MSIPRPALVHEAGKVLDTPFHRYADGVDLAGLSLESIAGLRCIVVDCRASERAIVRLPGDARNFAGAAVLVHTGWDQHWRTERYHTAHPHLTAEAADALVAAGAALVGIDSFNIDCTDTGERPVHSILLGAGIPMVEHLHLSETAGQGRCMCISILPSRLVIRTGTGLDRPAGAVGVVVAYSRMRLVLTAALLAFAAPAPALPKSLPQPLPRAALEEYRVPAGTRVGDTLRASFTIQEVGWRPEGPKGADLNAFAFVETGKPARIPGPLLRAPAGTVMRVTLRNALGVSMMVYGLNDHAADRGADSVLLAPSATRTVTFTVNASGTYYYYGRVRPAVQHPTVAIPDNWASGEKQEGPLVGALVVDARGTAPPRGERILLITRWLDDDDPRVHHDPAFKLMVNGASWPSTERLRYTVGDTVRWRVINATATQHPMHLHGFYYRVTGRGDGTLDTLYAPGQERRVVTEMLPLYGTMSLTWIPERAGNWLFHCHLVRHMALAQQIEPRTSSHDAHAAVHHAEDNMAGLVMGIHVAPRRGTLSAASLALASGRNPGAPARRALRVVATQRANVFGSSTGQSFIWQQGDAPAPDSVQFPGSTLVLHRGEPTAITVVNRLTSPLAVHWHGMEIESWFDGVGGWSGAGASVRPPIAPGDSFVVRMTPPRAGTFIYHTHDEAGSELSTGLYGALIVEDGAAPRDTTRDHVIVLGMLGKPGENLPSINGRTAPQPLVLAPGTHRLRFVSIPVDEQLHIAFMRDSTVQQWTMRAVDGADLPASQQRTVRGSKTVSAGQTFDVDVTIPPNDTGYALRVTTRWYPTDPRGEQGPVVLRVPIRTP